jgi:hypothetical protein
MLKLVIARTRGNDPEVHAAGCGDVKRGIRSGKYERDLIPIEVDEVEEAARYFWEDFLPGGCAYEEGGPGTGMTDADAQSYTKYLPCATQSGRTTKKETEMTTATKTPVTATTADQDAEAALLKGVVTDPKPAKARRGSPTPKAPKDSRNPAAPAKAAPAKKAPPTATEKILRPASKTVVAYVSWLKAELGPAEWAKLAKDPERLAQVSLTNYGAYRAQK